MGPARPKCYSCKEKNFRAIVAQQAKEGKKMAAKASTTDK